MKGALVFGEVIFMVLVLSSIAFKNQASIPRKYTGEGEDVNPPLTIEGIPQGTKTLALVMDDPFSPISTWVHWVMWNIPPVGIIAENSAPGVQGRNSSGASSYSGPNPPFGTHRYLFKVYALNTELSLNQSASKQDLEKAMEGHILAKAELVGLYTKG
jgi:hypothetical protein